MGAAISRDTVDAVNAYDILGGGIAEARVVISLLENELTPDPRAPGHTYGLNSEQTDMLMHMAHAVHRSIKTAMEALEARS